jgi:hypothetical protein
VVAAVGSYVVTTAEALPGGVTVDWLTVQTGYVVTTEVVVTAQLKSTGLVKVVSGLIVTFDVASAPGFTDEAG